MESTIRVRFAPSPTGPLHIGGVRTALFNYLFAKKHNGTFVLRIEDTDQARSIANAEQYIVDALHWCNIPFDEGPSTTLSTSPSAKLSTSSKNEKFGTYRQSERKHIYKQYADLLIEKGWAYYAFDTSEELNIHRKNSEEKGKTFIYNYQNRENGELVNSLVLSDNEVQSRIDSGENYVIRFKIPQDETLAIHDEIRGEITINTNVLDDKILFKSDGMPTYHLANVVDDYLMKISHVIRGEEWLPSMALHVLLYRAFGWNAPKFAHLPLILKPFGKGKLSKRDGDKLGFPVFPLEYINEQTGDVSRGYKEDGYFAEAFINMLAFLGWNPGTEQEIFSLEELVQAFDLKQVNKSGAKFNPEKAKWFQQQYMQMKSDEELADLFIKQFSLKKNEFYIELEKNSHISYDKNYVTTVVSLIKERATFVNDLWDLSSFFFVAPKEYNEKASKKIWKAETDIIMYQLIPFIKTISDFSSKNIEKEIKKWITAKEIGFGKVMQPLRLCLVGKLAGPHLFDIIELIGKHETITRIENAIETI